MVRAHRIRVAPMVLDPPGVKPMGKHDEQLQQPFTM
jgi:hypothetical protein